MIAKEDLISLFQKEFATTLKVMKAYPADQMKFAPHERSQPAMQLMATFVFEMYLLGSLIFGEKVDRSAFQQYAKETLDELIADFEKEATMVVDRMQNINENELSKTVKFAGAKFTADRFAMMMLFDQVHHRGQLSVYTRLAGGKVPSIYGPSADDPTTNF